MIPGGSRISAFTRSLRSIGLRSIDVVTSRSVVVICTTCAILYAGFWAAAVLQRNGLIGNWLPVPVADAVIMNRSGAELRSASVSQQELEERRRALGRSETAPPNSALAEGSAITLEIQTAPPVELWVTDSKGGELGTNPETGLVRLQIPGGAYSGRSSNPQLVSIPHAEGQYHIQLLGTANGTFRISVRAFPGDDVNDAVQFSGTGEVFEDTLLESLAEVSLEDGQPKLEVSPVRVLIAGKAPQVAGVAAPAPSASPEESASPSPEPVVQLPPAPPAPAPVVIRPRPAPQPPIPLPPLPVLPAQVAGVVAPPPSNVPAPAYGVQSNRAVRMWSSSDLTPREFLKVPEAILTEASSAR